MKRITQLLMEAPKLKRHATQMVCITPKDAVAILEQPENQGNRKLVRGNVYFLGAQIHDGKWVENNTTPIAFNTSGRLIDGQHRLHAVCLAKKAINALCAVNVPDNAATVIDCGAPRQLAARLTFSDFADVDQSSRTKLANIITTLTRLKAQSYTVASTKIDAEQARAIYNFAPDAIDFAVNYARGHQRGLTTADVCVAIAEYHIVNKAKAVVFAKAMLDSNTVIPQATALRAFLLATPGGGGALPTIRYRGAVAAMRGHMTGQLVGKGRVSINTSGDRWKWDAPIDWPLSPVRVDMFGDQK